MGTTSANPGFEVGAGLGAAQIPPWPSERSPFAPTQTISLPRHEIRGPRASGRDALQALLAFAALHQQVRQRRALAGQHGGFETITPAEFETGEQFLLDEVLYLVAERAIAITGADGLGIALAENNEIVLRASAGRIKPDVGARIDRDSAFSGACFRMAQIIRCDDTETDDRVNLNACRRLGARSMVAVPLCGRRRVIGLLEAFSSEPFGFNDSDVNSLELLAELILGALKPEDEDRFAESARMAEESLCADAIVPQVENEAEEASALAAPVRSLAEPALLDEPTRLTDSDPIFDTQADTQTDTSQAAVASGHHPGIVLVLVLVVISATLAGALWWKLKNAQLGRLMVQPEPKITRPATVAPVAPSSVPAATVPAATDSAEAGNGSAAAQEPSKPTRVTGIRHWSSADSSTVVLDLEDQVQYEAHRVPGTNRIYFDLHDTASAAELAGKTIEVGDALLARVRISQPASGLTRMLLETRSNSTFSVSLEPNPYRLVVQVRKVGLAPKAEVNDFQGAADQKVAGFISPIVVPPPSSEDLQLRARVPKMRIVVDAGHGGWDLGTVGRRGLLEKDLVLEIAQRLGKLLESRLGADVILTRNDDNYIPLDERAGLANQSQADLFISVHANYSDLASARGVETYYTNFFASPSAKDGESRDPNHAKNAGSTELSPVELHEKVEQSRHLAASVQRSLYGTLSAQNPGLRDRGVKEASYVVLTETTMPGILAEVSFVSSPTDEQKLQNDGYREQIAEALYRGIARYAAGSRGVKVASR